MRRWLKIGVARPATASGAKRRATVRARVALGVALVGALAFILPGASLTVAVDRARACFERVERGVVGDCSRAGGPWLWLPERVPFTRREAQLVREELAARAAVARYVEAAVVTLDGDEMARRFDAVVSAATLLEAGTGQLRLDVLGRSMPTPEPGEVAYAVGDFRTLTDRAFSWTQHYTEKHAIFAALAAGDTVRALRIGKHYEGRPNSDERVLLGALACIDGRYDRAIEHVAEVVRSRQDKRHANFSRNYGDARIVLVACARLAGKSPPDEPEVGDAGEIERALREVVLAASLRHARPRRACDAGDRDCDAAQETDAFARTVKLLTSGAPVTHRLALVALVASHLEEGAELARAASPPGGEAPLVDRLPWSVDAWTGATAREPFVPAEHFARAARHAAELAGQRGPTLAGQRAAELGGQRGAQSGAELTGELARLSGALWLMAARGYALGGEAPKSQSALEIALIALKPSSHRAQLVRSSLASVLGEREAPQGALRAEGAGAPELSRGTESLAEARLEALRARGTAPPEPRLAGTWLALSRLAGDPKRTERWLDALTAFDAERLALPRYLWLRHELASARGDAEAAAAWLARFRTLARSQEHEQHGELWRVVLSP